MVVQLGPGNGHYRQGGRPSGGGLQEGFTVEGDPQEREYTEIIFHIRRVKTVPRPMENNASSSSDDDSDEERYNTY